MHVQHLHNTKLLLLFPPFINHLPLFLHKCGAVFLMLPIPINYRESLHKHQYVYLNAPMTYMQEVFSPGASYVLVHVTPQ